MTIKIIAEKEIYGIPEKLYIIEGEIKTVYKRYRAEIYAPSRGWAKRSGAGCKLVKKFRKDNEIDAIFWQYKDYLPFQKVEFI